MLAVLLSVSASSAAFADIGNTGPWGDQGNGTYTNPILPADYSDPDVILVGSDYYLVSSTLQLSGGVVVLHSRDLVNWETIGYVSTNPAVQFGDSRFNYTEMNHYNSGVYAPSIRYHDGKFWVYVTTWASGGLYLATATDPAGPWAIQVMKDKNGDAINGLSWDDPCPFWDDDGKAYLVASQPGKFWYPILFQMTPDGTQLLDATVAKMRLETSDSTDRGTNIYPQAVQGEGNKILKMRGYYYLFHNDNGGGTRKAIMIRSKNLYGTLASGAPGGPGNPGSYDKSPQGTADYIMIHGDAAGKTTGRFDQGSLISSPDGAKWYFLSHQGAGYTNGRPIGLFPVTWTADWPMAGVDSNNDGIGEPVWTVEKPVAGQPMMFPQGSDEFSEATLHPRWQWNYQPRADKWSLTARPGFLRLSAFKPITSGTFFKAGNTIGQRYMKGDSVQVDVKIDIGNMADGEEAGLCHFNGGKDYATIGIVQSGTVRALKYDSNGTITKGDQIHGASATIWLRSKVDKSSSSTCYFSYDGTTFTQLGGTFALKWGGYRGDYIGVYNYNDTSESGFVDVDWFHYTFAGPALTTGAGGAGGGADGGAGGRGGTTGAGGADGGAGGRGGTTGAGDAGGGADDGAGGRGAGDASGADAATGGRSGATGSGGAGGVDAVAAEDAPALGSGGAAGGTGGLATSSGAGLSGGSPSGGGAGHGGTASNAGGGGVSGAIGVSVTAGGAGGGGSSENRGGSGPVAGAASGSCACDLGRNSRGTESLAFFGAVAMVACWRRRRG
jgi:beta-xylosidase